MNANNDFLIGITFLGAPIYYPLAKVPSGFFV